MKDSGLTPGASYNHTTTLPSGIISQPPTPGQSSSSGFDLSWEAVPGALGYKIYIGDQLVATTIEMKLHLTNLESSKVYDNVRVVPFNDAGEGDAFAVPAIETLPSSDFTAEAVTKGTSSIELKCSLASQNETFVLASGDKEMYRGKDRSFLWTGLSDGTSYTLQIWMENADGVKSEAKTVVGRTDSASHGGGGGGIAVPVPVTDSVTKPADPVTVPTTTEPNSTAPHFEDIDTTFNKDQINTLFSLGVIQCVTPTKFESYRAITRAEFTALVVRLMGFDTTSANYSEWSGLVLERNCGSRREGTRTRYRQWRVRAERADYPRAGVESSGQRTSCERNKQRRKGRPSKTRI